MGLFDWLGGKKDPFLEKAAQVEASTRMRQRELASKAATEEAAERESARLNKQQVAHRRSLYYALGVEGLVRRWEHAALRAYGRPPDEETDGEFGHSTWRAKTFGSYYTGDSIALWAHAGTRTEYSSGGVGGHPGARTPARYFGVIAHKVRVICDLRRNSLSVHVEPGDRFISKPIEDWTKAELEQVLVDAL